MDELKKSIHEFIETLSSSGVRGEFQRRTTDWPSELPTSPEVALFFDDYQPVNVKIETGMWPLRLFEVSKLVNAQLGYRRDGKTGQRIPTWPNSYLVVGDDLGGGKPVIAVTDQPGTPVFASYDVAPPFQISDSMKQFFDALARLVEIVYGRYKIFEIYTDDEELKPEFVQEITEALSPVLGEDNFSRFFDYVYG
jgi:hypothetical protein